MCDEKYNKLIEYLKKIDGIAIAFSGGVDSSFLLKAVKDAGIEKILAITISSPYIARWEIKEAVEFAKKLDVKHKVIEINGLKDIKFNPEDRCYICKKNIFSLIKAEAKNEGIEFVADGTNADDINDYRPGIKALRELKILSPLLENKITKKEIRHMSKKLNLNTWDKPAYACLLSRIPYKTEITLGELSKIESAEKYLMDIGFKAVRVRSHNDIARIEVLKEERRKLFDEELMDEIAIKLKQIGYKYVTMELAGYKMGSLNTEILHNEL